MEIRGCHFCARVVRRGGLCDQGVVGIANAEAIAEVRETRLYVMELEALLGTIPPALGPILPEVFEPQITQAVGRISQAEGLGVRTRVVRCGPRGCCCYRPTSKENGHPQILRFEPGSNVSRDRSDPMITSAP